MTSILAQLFVTPVDLSGPQRAALILPLCLAIAIIYKITRIRNLHDLPAGVMGLWVTIVVGMYAVGIGLWVVYRLLV